jgi:hypothetical protein
VVEGWPDDVNDAPFSLTAAEEGVRLAESISAVVGASAGPDSET